MKSIIINASNCHQGGGKTLLDAFINGITYSEDRFIIFIDSRYIPPIIENINITYKKINIFSRPFVSYLIKKIAKPNDLLIYFGNLPPILKFDKQHVILLLSNRFYIDSISFQGFRYKDILKLKLEKLYFRMFIYNVNEFIVQTNTMKNLLHKNIFIKAKVRVLPFDNTITSDNLNLNKEPNSFIYVASLMPYKNHRKLIEAWNKLKVSGISIKLYLTIDQDNNIKKWIKKYISNNNLNIILLENISRSELIKIYENCEYLIYPSYFEAYGLPLIEAVNYKLKILAADVDYCWDLINPNDYFNPHDVSSIERCILRAINMSPQKNNILTPKDFINKIL
jgi:glycosyltransferase involved in cell wall biosynthesis